MDGPGAIRREPPSENQESIVKGSELKKALYFSRSNSNSCAVFFLRRREFVFVLLAKFAAAPGHDFPGTESEATIGNEETREPRDSWVL